MHMGKATAAPLHYDLFSCLKTFLTCLNVAEKFITLQVTWNMSGTSSAPDCS